MAAPRGRSLNTTTWRRGPLAVSGSLLELVGTFGVQLELARVLDGPGRSIEDAKRSTLFPVVEDRAISASEGLGSALAFPHIQEIPFDPTIDVAVLLASSRVGEDEHIRRAITRSNPSLPLPAEPIVQFNASDHVSRFKLPRHESTLAGPVVGGQGQRTVNYLARAVSTDRSRPCLRRSAGSASPSRHSQLGARSARSGWSSVLHDGRRKSQTRHRSGSHLRAASGLSGGER